MIYPYECPKCHEYKEITCGVDEMPKSIQCETCKIPMPRIITAPQLKIPKPYIDSTFGKEIRQESQVKEELKRHHGETGQEMIPLGDQKLEGIAPPKHDLGKLVDDLASQGVFDNVDSAEKSIYDD
jgi:hypothetical protein